MNSISVRDVIKTFPNCFQLPIQQDIPIWENEEWYFDKFKMRPLKTNKSITFKKKEIKKGGKIYSSNRM